MSKVVIISGSSGSGKTTISKYLLSISKFKLKFSISACTRERRKEEVHGSDYIFLELPVFKHKIKNKEFLEWEEVYENQFYGTLKVETEKVLNSGYNILFDVDIKGALALKQYYNERAISIFVKPSSIETLKNRLINRKTETKLGLKRRIDKMQNEIAQGVGCDKVLLNDDLVEAKRSVYVTIKQFLAT